MGNRYTTREIVKRDAGITVRHRVRRDGDRSPAARVGAGGRNDPDPIADLELRLRTYPHYVERLAGMSVEEFFASLSETPESQGVLSRFAKQWI